MRGSEGCWLRFWTYIIPSLLFIFYRGWQELHQSRILEYPDWKQCIVRNEDILQVGKIEYTINYHNDNSPLLQHTLLNMLTLAHL